MKKYFVDNEKFKAFVSEDYNFTFDKVNGDFVRWGKDSNDDPIIAPFPEIADIEISTVCSGIKGKTCKFCYKSNTSKGKNMSLETFKKVFSKLPKPLTQIAFGIGDVDANKDLFKIFKHTRDNGVIPNVTINGDRLTSSIAEQLAKYCGAIAVSCYDKDLCYSVIKKLNKLGIKQTNIHFMLAEQTYEFAMEVLQDLKAIPELKAVNAIVFLSLKQRGRAEKHFTRLSDEKFKTLVDFSLDNNIPLGFDSCTANKFLEAIKDNKDYTRIATSVEPCESGIFSSYINVDGKYFPCSFCENILEDFKEGLDVVTCNDFTKDIWNNEKNIKWRKRLNSCNRSCPVFNV